MPKFPTELLEEVSLTLPKRPVGNPTKYKPEYCDLLVQIYARGEFVETFCVDVGITEKTFYNWVNNEEEFNEAYEFAKLCSRSVWTKALAHQALSKEKYANAAQLAILINNRLRDTYSRNNDASGTTQNFTVNVMNLSNTELDKKIKLLSQAVTIDVDSTETTVSGSLGREGTEEQVQ